MVSRVAAACVATLVCLAATTACAGGGTRADAVARTWRANADGALLQLRGDIATAAVGGDTEAEARVALRSESDLFALLVVYSDLGGCGAIMDKVGAPVGIEAVLRLPCPRLERAATAFSNATARSDPGELVRAGDEARHALPSIVQALATVHGDARQLRKRSTSTATR